MDQPTERIIRSTNNGPPPLTDRRNRVYDVRLASRHTADGVPIVHIRQLAERRVELERPMRSGFLFGVGTIAAWLLFGTVALLVTSL